MGCYEEEMKLVEAGLAERGKACRDYYARRDSLLPDGFEAHRPDYTDTLFAPQNDDIYHEFCDFLDQPKPRSFDAIENPVVVEGYTAADVYHQMIGNNWREAKGGLDPSAVYEMLVMLRDEPEIAKRIIDFKPKCINCGD